MEEALYWYWLANIIGVGTVAREKLLKELKEPKKVWQASNHQLKGIVSDHQIEKIIQSKDLEAIKNSYRKLAYYGIQFIHRTHPKYPEKLINIPGSPVGLYLRGKLPEKSQPLIAMVGTRTPSTYGIQMTRWFARELSRAGIGIISGMAAGIDAISHRETLEQGKYTVGVLGGGIDTMYPKNNFSLYMDMYERGGILSEYNMGIPNRAGLFPERNRIISGLADAVLIVEAAKKSGSLITADHALEQGKDIYVIPGRITDPLSQGCNGLIKQGAEPVQSPEEIIEDFKDKLKSSRQVMSREKNPVENNIALEEKEKIVYEAIKYDEAKSAAILSREVKMEISEVLRLLLNLEMSGRIIRDGQQEYVRKL